MPIYLKHKRLKVTDLFRFFMRQFTLKRILTTKHFVEKIREVLIVREKFMLSFCRLRKEREEYLRKKRLKKDGINWINKESHKNKTRVMIRKLKLRKATSWAFIKLLRTVLRKSIELLVPWSSQFFKKKCFIYSSPRNVFKASRCGGVWQ